MRARVRTEKGFGLVELIISMTMLSVALLALVAGFNSGLLALQRAGKTSTAATMADQQMERYRALKYCDIRLDDAALPGPAPYTTDPAYSASQVLDTTLCAGATPTCAAGPPPECNPSRVVPGPDNRNYRVDTYIVSQTDGGRPLKLVTAVVRDPESLSSRSSTTTRPGGSSSTTFSV
ncbi:MAG: prepilin-type N-terminal cleavage/methylation domain-containing protein, partial [Gaiellaceae bacterium]